MKHTSDSYEIITADLGDEIPCIVPVELKATNGKTIVSYNGGLAPEDECWTSDELFANAKLLAAAPYMLSTLKRIRNYLYDNDIHGYLMMEVKAAIAKAEGR